MTVSTPSLSADELAVAMRSPAACSRATLGAWDLLAAQLGLELGSIRRSRTTARADRGRRGLRELSRPARRRYARERPGAAGRDRRPRGR